MPTTQFDWIVTRDAPVTLDVVIKEIRLLAKQYPDFIYTPLRAETKEFDASCAYVQDGKGGCIVGQAALDLGLITVAIEDTPADNTDTGAESLMSRLRDASVITYNHLGPRDSLDRVKLRWIAFVQTNQDKGNPWGGCVTHADETFPEVAAAGI